MEEKEIKTLNIFEKLSIISTELSAVAKNLEVGFGQSKYKAVGEADILHAIKPLEGKYRVYSYPYSRDIIESGTLENVDKNGVVKKQLFERIKVTYRFINIDNTSEFIDVVSYGDGVDPQDKSVGKAMTYADKYALMKAYKIITGEDPDQYASEAQSAISTKKVNKPISAETLAKCEELDIKLENLATFYKKPVEELTEEEVIKAAMAKAKRKQAMAAKKQEPETAPAAPAAPIAPAAPVAEPVADTAPQPQPTKDEEDWL